MSSNLNMSTERLSSWQRAAQRAGGSAEGITAQLKSSADEVARFNMGQSSEAMQWFFRLGGSVDAIKDGNSYLLARSKIIHDIFQIDPAKAGLVASQMGISEEQFNLIKQGPSAILALVGAQQKNSVITAAQAKAALDLRNKYLDLKDSMTASATTVLITLMPTIERFIAWLQQMAEWIAANRKEIVAWIETIAGRIGEVVKAMDKGAEAVGGWKNVLIALLALKVLSFTTGLLGMALALGKVGGSLAVIGSLGGVVKLLGMLGLALHTDNLNEGEAGDLARQKAYTGPANGGNNMRSRQQYLVAKLRAEGFSDVQSAGIVGSLMQESQLDPASVNPKSGASGIGQWLGSRKKQFTQDYGMTPDKAPFEQQVDFMLWELRNTEKRSAELIKRAKTADQAAAVHTWEYERPGVAEAGMANRNKYAASVLAGINQSNGTPQLAGSNITSETHIGKIEVHTNATDAAGIANDIGPALQQQGLVAQANGGLS